MTKDNIDYSQQSRGIRTQSRSHMRCTYQKKNGYGDNLRDQQYQDKPPPDLTDKSLWTSKFHDAS
ncbi:MAG: hypothetical protein WCP01_07930 [Methylococcaceae bacterium]